MDLEATESFGLRTHAQNLPMANDDHPHDYHDSINYSNAPLPFSDSVTTTNRDGQESPFLLLNDLKRVLSKPLERHERILSRPNFGGPHHCHFRDFRFLF